MAKQTGGNGNGGGSAAPLLIRRLRPVLHLLAALHFAYGIYYDCSYVYFADSPRSTQWGGKFKYLTFLDMIIQAVYFTLALLNDTLGSNEIAPVARLPLLRRFKDYWLAAFAFPLAFNVGISFWALWHIDRELVLPRALDAILPGWLNHVMHTNIMIFITIELLTTFRQYPARSLCLKSLATFMAAYLVWLHVVRYNSGVWVYPVLDVLELPQRIVFFAVCIVVAVGLYFLGELLNAFAWRSELRRVAAGKNKAK